MKLLIYCAGGFGREVMDTARRRNAASGCWDSIDFVDDVIEERARYGARVHKFDDQELRGRLQDFEFVIASGEPEGRRALAEKLDAAGARLGTVIDPSVLIADTALIAEGVVITPFCSISSDARLARNCCVNTMSIVGHDVEVGENSVISSMVNIGGRSTIGANAYVGMGALIKDKIAIGANTIVGMASVVYSDIPPDVIALGNPARAARHNVDKRVFK